jgi:hypothetical protein
VRFKGLKVDRIQVILKHKTHDDDFVFARWPPDSYIIDINTPTRTKMSENFHETDNQADAIAEHEGQPEASNSTPCSLNASEPAKKLKLAINRQLIDKNVAGGGRLFVDGWQNVELTTTELGDIVQQGIAYTAQLSGPRRAANFLASDIGSVDIDKGLRVEEALTEQLVRGHGTLLYTTASHRPDRQRFRIIFALPRTITDQTEMRAVTRSLALRLRGDPSVSDPARLFFGNRSAEVHLIGRAITMELLLRQLR